MRCSTVLSNLSLEEAINALNVCIESCHEYTITFLPEALEAGNALKKVNLSFSGSLQKDNLSLGAAVLDFLRKHFLL